MPAGGAAGEQLRVAPFFVASQDSPTFNQLFAGLYDLIFSKLTRTAHLVPSVNRNIRAIFAEKVHGHDDLFIVSSKTIAYLKWLIYIAAFKDEKSRALMEDMQFYVAEYKSFEDPENNFWRKELLKQLEIWYQEHPPTSKKRKSNILQEFDNIARSRSLKGLRRSMRNSQLRLRLRLRLWAAPENASGL